MGKCCDNSDTINLLKECDAGSKMAVTSIDDVLDDVQDKKMKKLLIESKDHHTKLGNEIHEQLNRNCADEKEPNAMARGMSWLKTNMKLGMGIEDTDKTIADLMTDGCNMGVKSLNKYLNQYKNADEVSQKLCMRLIKIEEKLCEELEDYL
jgi:hypothetical protein